MRDAINAHIAAVNAFYRPVIVEAEAAGRMTGGARLLGSFDQAVAAFHKIGRRQASGIIERVNELAAARMLLNDARFATGMIAYEPEIVTGSRFDFVVRRDGESTLYIEVKTVCPFGVNDGASWRKATYRRRNVAPGLAENGNAARAAFWRYAQQTVVKFAAHSAVAHGRAVLVVCGNGFGWQVSLLEEFAQFYAQGGAAPWVAHSLSGFGVLIRAQEAVEPSAWALPVGRSLHGTP